MKLLADNEIPVGIVTGAQRDDVLAVLDGSPTGELVGVLIAEEDVSNGKPHPEGFLDRGPDTESPAQRCARLRRFRARRTGRSGRGHALHRRRAAEPSRNLRAAATAIVAELSAVLVEIRSAAGVAGRAPTDSARDLMRIRARSERW